MKGEKREKERCVWLSLKTLYLELAMYFRVQISELGCLHLISCPDCLHRQ